MKLRPDEVCYETRAGVLQDLQEFWEPSLTTDYYTLVLFLLNYPPTSLPKHIYYGGNKTYINAVAFGVMNDALNLASVWSKLIFHFIISCADSCITVSQGQAL